MRLSTTRPACTGTQHLRAQSLQVLSCHDSRLTATIAVMMLHGWYHTFGYSLHQEGHAPQSAARRRSSLRSPRCTASALGVPCRAAGAGAARALGPQSLPELQQALQLRPVGAAPLSVMPMTVLAEDTQLMQCMLQTPPLRPQHLHSSVRCTISNSSYSWASSGSLGQPALHLQPERMPRRSSLKI